MELLGRFELSYKQGGHGTLLKVFVMLVIRWRFLLASGQITHIAFHAGAEKSLALVIMEL